MLSLLFYLIIFLVLVAVMFLFYWRHKQTNQRRIKKRAHLVKLDSPSFTKKNSLAGVNVTAENSPYDPNLVILRLNAFPGKPYMGYELHQALLAAGLRFGERKIFHRYADNGEDKVLFSIAAATPEGSFAIENMGSFKCNGLLLFMYLDPKQKLMVNFDLMLDTARQLAEELGGEIYDDLHQFINADVIKRLREKICMVETNNLYTADLLDNLN